MRLLRQGPSLVAHDEQYAENSHYPFALLAVQEQSLALWAVYDEAWFDEQTVQGIVEQLITLLIDFTESLDRPLCEAMPLPEGQRSLIENTFNDTEVDFGAPLNVYQLIENKARENPDHIALVDPHSTTTYGELTQQVELLAAQLSRRGVTANIPVPVLMKKSCNAIVATLAVMKAGGAYVPLDPSWPPERIVSVCQTLQANLSVALTIVVDRHSAENLVLEAETLEIEQMLASEIELPQASDRRDASHDLAYVIFTSGSTGEPKGVMVEHRNLYNSTLARDHFYDNPPSVFLLLSPLATDSSIAGLFWTLVNGGTLLLSGDRAEQDPVALCEYASKYKVTHLLCLPSLYMALLEYGQTSLLREFDTAIVAGEACGDALVKMHHRSLTGVKLYNEYGPSEACVWATAARLEDRSAVNIGRPISNCFIYVLDEQLRQVPIGVAGELYIGGANLARGYYGLEAKTKERFVSDPFSAAESRIYRTGDLVAWRDDGALDFLGRVDTQVKVRGYRVEIEEIEHATNTFAGVAECAVLVDEDGNPADDEATLLESLMALPPHEAKQLLDDISGLSEMDVLAQIQHGPDNGGAQP